MSQLDNNNKNKKAYSVTTNTALVEVGEYIRECVDVPRFLGYCRECNNFGRRWACPSFDFEPLGVWQRFCGLWLVNLVLRPEPGTGLEELLAGLQTEKDLLHEALLRLEGQVPGAYALSAGSCYLCGAECSRTAGEPCRQPERMRYSIEALGGDVAKTGEKYLATPLLWIRQGEMPEYLTLVGGLLLPGAEHYNKQDKHDKEKHDKEDNEWLAALFAELMTDLANNPQ